jgi:hypothetical protein
MLPVLTTISKGQTQEWSWPWVIYGLSLPWMVMVWPIALGQKHQLIIESPVGPSSRSIVVSISQTGTAILQGSYVVCWSPLSVLPTSVASSTEFPEHEYVPKTGSPTCTGYSIDSDIPYKIYLA